MQSRAPEEDDPNLCKLLQMKAQPYFGIYSENYSWALPIGKFEPKNTNQIYKNLPSSAKHDLKGVNDAVSSPQFKFMVLNLNLEELYHEAFVQKNLKSKNSIIRRDQTQYCVTPSALSNCQIRTGVSRQK